MSVKNELVVMIGFDCDRPRGDFIFTKKGNEMANRKFASIQKISKELESLSIPRTFFICGQFLESMTKKFGKEAIESSFVIDSNLVEIGDHTYSHNIVKPIATRSDKVPSSLSKIRDEYNINTKLFQEIFNLEIPSRGFRAPLGHYNGLIGEDELLDLFKELKIKYISSDLRDKRESLNPSLKNHDGTPRQPYRYHNGLLEIPTMGWQDTVFSGTTKTPLFEEAPTTYEQIISYFNILFENAKKIVTEKNINYFLGLTLHPYDNSFYNKDGRFFEKINEFVAKCGGRFSTYEAVNDEFQNRYGTKSFNVKLS